MSGTRTNKQHKQHKQHKQTNTNKQTQTNKHKQTNTNKQTTLHMNSQQLQQQQQPSLATNAIQPNPTTTNNSNSNSFNINAVLYPTRTSNWWWTGLKLVAYGGALALTAYAAWKKLGQPSSFAISSSHSHAGYFALLLLVVVVGGWCFRLWHGMTQLEP